MTKSELHDHLNALERFIDAVLTADDGGGSFGRGFRGEWVPDPRRHIRALRAHADNQQAAP